MEFYVDDNMWKMVLAVRAEMILNGKIKPSKGTSNTSTAAVIRFLIKEGLKNYLFEDSR
jgi:hypothetical protein